MKNHLLIPVLFLFALTASAQTKIKIVVPFIKEERILDSLFDKILLISDPKTKYYGIQVLSTQEGCQISWEELKNDGTNVQLHFLAPVFIQNLCYFTYRKCIIFMYGDSIPSVFFRPTVKEKPFSFIWYRDFIDNPHHYPNGSVYDLKNGRLEQHVSILR